MLTSTCVWDNPSVAGHGPGPRIGHSSVRVGSQIFVFAGKAETYVNTLHVLDLSAMRWREVQPETPPPRRAYHTANAVPAASRFLVFGGTAPADVGAGGAAHDFFNDVWLYKVEAFAWEACRVIGEPPPPRAAHSAVLLPQPNAKLVVFGGTDSERIFGDTWLLHLMDTRWEKAATHGPRPSRRCYHSATLVRQQMLVFGGRGHGKYAPPCMLAFDLLTCEWRQVPHDAHAPAKGRTSHAAIAIGDCLLVYGGKTVREDGAGEWRTDSVLLFDAASMRWLPPPEVRTPAACTELHRSAHTATCGTRGVLVIGGYAGEGRYLESVLSLELLPCQLPGAWAGARDTRKRPRRDGGGLGSDDGEATSDAFSRPQGLAGRGNAVGEGEGAEEREKSDSLAAGSTGASGVRHERTSDGEAQLFARLQQAELSLSEALEAVRARDAQLSAALQRAHTLEEGARRQEAALTEAAVCEQRALEAERRAVIRCELAESKGMENSMAVQLANKEIERGKEALREAVARAELAERKASELSSSVEKLTSVHQSSESARVQLEEQLRSKSEKLAVVESELKAERDFRAKCEAEATSQRATLATLGTALGQRDLNLQRLQSQLHEVDEQKKELQQQECE
ncbi:hypothetical protein AB1Y20_003037 [Prymnesium parvum]|uniref:Uncharacterized protein n=1 Tax=Prymnesium parvum TaxID=97485 RepID=A0AB34JDF1_PRYPA